MSYEQPAFAQLPQKIQETLQTFEALTTKKIHTVEDLSQQMATFQEIVEFVLECPPDSRESIIDHLSPKHDWLFYHANLGAILAVRENSEDWILHGLIALVLEDVQEDYTETLCYLSFLGHSARKISCQLQVLVDRAVNVARAECGDLIRDFFERDLEGQSIRGMGYKEGTNKYGEFVYRRR